MKKIEHRLIVKRSIENRVLLTVVTNRVEPKKGVHRQWLTHLSENLLYNVNMA